MKRTKAMYPGTFDPVHYGHLDLMKRGAILFSELVVAVYDHRVPTKSILFSVDERIEMLQTAMKGLDNVTVTRFSGLAVDFARDHGIQVFVRGLRVFSDFEFEFRLALANKRLAPEIETISLMTHEEHMFLSGTTVREVASLNGDVSSMVPEHVARALYARFNSNKGEEFSRPVPLRD
jgi:pantetheine-phosphate adenylyltransferase